jgi:hypothetical protein
MVFDGASVATQGHATNKVAPSTPSGSATPPAHRKRYAPWLSVLGLLMIAYVLGAAVMFFQLPTCDFLAKAFLGARAWKERQEVEAQVASTRQHLSAGPIDRPGKTFDGFTLYSCMTKPSPRSEALLLNMHREVVHRWSVSLEANPSQGGGSFGNSSLCIFACHPYPNGDLLVVASIASKSSFFGLVKLNRDSKVLWRYPAPVHHDVDVGEDGTICTIAYDHRDAYPRGMTSIPLPWKVDSLVLLSGEGTEIRKPIPIFDALLRSPYAPLLSPLHKPRIQLSQHGGTLDSVDEIEKQQDVLHTNSARMLSRALAPKFPRFKAGQVLLTIRTLDILVVLDPQTETVVWAARGPWRGVHDAQFLDNGHLLIFDNLGSPSGSRVLEYDPESQAFPWTYPGDDDPPFFTAERGMNQRLPNGNTLIVNSDGGQILEVARDHELVWSCPLPGFIATARRYAPEQLPFLKGGPRGRP